MDPVSNPCDRVPIPVYRDGGINQTKVKIFFGKLEKSYKRFNNPKHSQGLFYRLCGDSSPTQNTNKGKIKPSSGRNCITGGKRTDEEGYHKGVNSLQGPVCQTSVPSIKEQSKTTTSDKPERVEHIHTLKTFQDRRAQSKGNFGTRRLSMQVALQRRLFLCSIEQTVKETCAFQMGEFPVRIPLSVFWTWFGPKVCLKNK